MSPGVRFRPARLICTDGNKHERSSASVPLHCLIQGRADRRAFLKSTSQLAGGGLVAMFPPSITGLSAAELSFVEIERGKDERLHVPPGYEANVLLRWGDPVLDGVPRGSTNSSHGLLCINHEYTQARHMFPERASGQI